MCLSRLVRMRMPFLAVTGLRSTCASWPRLAPMCLRLLCWKCVRGSRWRMHWRRLPRMHWRAMQWPHVRRMYTSAPCVLCAVCCVPNGRDSCEQTMLKDAGQRPSCVVCKRFSHDDAWEVARRCVIRRLLAHCVDRVEGQVMRGLVVLPRCLVHASSHILVCNDV